MKPSRFVILASLLLLPVVWLAMRPDEPRASSERFGTPAVHSRPQSPALADAPATAVAMDHKTPQLVAAKPTGDARSETGTPLPPDFLDRIVNGVSVAFALPDGSQAEGTVETSERDAQGIVRVQGRLTRPAAGRYFIQRQTVAGVAGPFIGNVLFDGKDQGWRVEPTADFLSARFVPRPVDQIACSGFKRNPLADKLEEEGRMMAMTDFKGPQDHPTNEPLPPYQPVPALQSRPTAIGVIYLDFDGEKGPIQGWGNFDVERANTTNPQIIEIWKMVSEDFQPFNLNVTTDRKVFDNAPQGRRQHVLITPTTTSTPVGAAGVAFGGSFNWGGDYPCWAHYTLGVYATHVISHEVGHTLGLDHDGLAGVTEYYQGHGSGATGWGPIMGDGSSRNLDTWSKGEYTGATNVQDDLAIIANNNNGVGFREDDTGDTLATAKYLEIFPGNTVSSEGFIGTTGDIDAFRFVTSGGLATFNLNTIATGPDLDILAEIVNATTNAVITSGNPDGALNATVSADLPAGQYLLRVRGTGRGNPQGDGYSNYASLGTYIISGSVSGGVQADRFDIPENPANGDSIGTVAARVNHGANPVTWSIASGNGSGGFTINPATGELTVANPAVFDYELQSPHWDDPATLELFVTIADSTNPSLSESIRVVVTVINENETPSIQNGSATILERRQIGTVVGTVVASDPDEFDFPTFEIIAGDSDGLFAIDAGSGKITVAANIEVPATTTYNLTILATDHGTNWVESQYAVTVVNIAAGYLPGSIVRTYFENIAGSSVANLTASPKFPNIPDSQEILNAFDGGVHGDNYGSQIRGYLIPPVTGAYQFWIASDDSSELRFNSAGPASAGASVIASLNGAVTRYAWTAVPSQQSVTLNLIAGQPCYIEARHKESGGDDHVAVAWSGPGIAQQVIPGGYMAPFDAHFAPKVQAATFNVFQSVPANSTVGVVSATDVNGGVHSFSITNGNAAGIFGIDAVTGRISIAQAGLLNAAGTPTYNLTVQVTDSESPASSGSGTITINVIAGTTQRVWTNSAGGSWPVAGNWLGNNIANGNTEAGNFATLDLTANATVTLDGSRTIADLLFADSTPSHDWTLAGGGVLTLSDLVDHPEINVSNRAVTLAVGLAGTQGLEKTGVGLLALTGVNSYSGATTVTAGTLQVGNGFTNSSINEASPVAIAAGATAKWWSIPTGDYFNYFYGLPNAISGSGQWILQGTNAVVAEPDGMPDGMFSLTGDNSGFSGELIVNRAVIYGADSTSRLGTGTIRIQDRGSLNLSGGFAVPNTISIENGAGWHFDYGIDLVPGAIWMGGGGNTFTGNLQLNQNTGVINGDPSGTNSTLGAIDSGTNTFSGVISGAGELSMSCYTAWGGGAVDIDISGSASNTYTGKTVVNGQNNAVSLRLMKTFGAVAIPGGNTVQLGNVTEGQANLRMGDTTATGATRNQWNDQFGSANGGVVLKFVNAPGDWMRFDLQGTQQSVAGLIAGDATTPGGAIIQNQNVQAFDPGQDATLTLIGGESYLYNGILRDQDNGGTTRKLHLIKSGIGTQILAGSAITYTGTTTVNTGTLLMNGSLGNSATTIAAVGILGGTGSTAGPVSNFGTLAPGSNAVGNLTINNTVTLAGGSKVAWQISNWTGVAGSGFDKLTTNSLNITATSANRITLKLTDLSVANFSETNKSFVLIQTTSGVTGFSADKFVVDDSDIIRPQGTWAVQQSANNLVLVYTGYTGSNIAPEFTADPITASATEDAAFSGTITATDANAGDTLTYTKLTGPGWLSVASDGALSGTPVNSNVGVNTFTVRVMDSTGAIDEAVLQVTVANVNDAPGFTVDPINQTVGEGQSITGQLAATDVDAGDTLTFSKVSGPAWLNVAANGALSGISGSAGVGVFTVRVQDAAGAFADATMNITVVSYDGVWGNAAGGSWPTGTNWGGGHVAGGAGKTADFSTLDLAANATVTLDSPRTIGNMTFGDTTPSHQWTLNSGSGGALTLDVATGTPTITVNNQTTTLNLQLAGSNGFGKAGTGSLVLSGNNAYTGATTVSQGILYLNGGGPTIPGNLTVNGPDGTYVRMQQANQFGAGAVADFSSAYGSWNRFELLGKDQVLAGINTGTATTPGGGVVQNSETDGAAGANGTLTLNGTGSSVFHGHLRDCGNAAVGTDKLSLVKGGTGTQTLIGEKISYSGNTTVNAGTLVFTPVNADWTLTSVTKTINSSGTLKMDFSPQTTQYRQTNLNTTVINPGGVLELYGTADNVDSHYLINAWTATGAGTIRVTGGGSVAVWTGASNPLSGFTGLLDIQNGRFAANTSTTLGGTLDVNIAALGKLDLRSGHFTIDALDGAAGSFVHKSYTGDTINFTIGNNNGSGNFAGVMQGTNYNVIKTGTGTQTLSGANSYTGTTTVSAGTLLINGSQANTTTTVAAAATLGGTGSIAGAVTNNGSLAPGSSGVGNLTVNNALTLAGGSKLAWQIGNWTGAAGSGWDKVTATSLNLAATSGNRITIKPADVALTNFTETNASFVIVQSSGISGFSADKFTIDTSGLTLPHGTWAVQQSGNNLVLAYTAAANPDANANGILDSWEIARFGNANPGANLASDDPDHDGLSNLLEYALDTNPTAGNANPLVHDQETLGDGKHLRITVVKNPTATNLTYTVESGGALNDWSSANTTIETNNANQLIVRDNFAQSTASCRFIRLKVISNSP